MGTLRQVLEATVSVWAGDADLFLGDEGPSLFPLTEQSAPGRRKPGT